MGTPISRETFENMPVENKLDVLFDNTAEICAAVKETKTRVQAIEQGQIKDRRKELAIAGFWGGIGGLAGGISAVAGYLKWWGK